MLQLYPQPVETTVAEPCDEVDGTCERCGAQQLRRYRVADYRGWLRVIKCRSCLWLAQREPIRPPVLTGG